jgi:hypothetical protein
MTAHQYRALLCQQPSQVVLPYLQHAFFALQPSEILALLFPQVFLLRVVGMMGLMGLHT